MTKIYTRTGDSGETSLLGGQRVRKDNLRIEAIGSVDECNAALGVVRMELTRSGIAPIGMDELLARVQHRLFDLGAELAMPPSAVSAKGTLSDGDIVFVESAIDEGEATLAPLRNFILPGGSAAAAQLHLARCVCRRAERRLVELADAETVRDAVLQYVNRIGDLLFVLARVANQANRMPDIAWERGSEE
jgi:cob(I)alamin adenosyltransferase